MNNVTLIKKLRELPKSKKEIYAMYGTVVVVCIIILSWFAFIGGFTGYFKNDNEKINDQTRNPFSIISDIFQNPFL